MGTNELTLEIDQCQIKSSKEDKLLGITIDNKLSFDAHVNNICNKVSQKNKCVNQNCELHKPCSETYSNESFHHLSIWVLPSSVDVS